MILVVDDLRVFPFPATYARTSAEGLSILNVVENIDELWLDHDLGGDDTTMAVVDYLMERGFYDWLLPIGRVFVHTDNTPAGDTIVRCLRNYYPTITRVDARMMGAHVP